MPLWRREPLHERLAREAGLDASSEPPPHDAQPRWGEAGIHGVPRPREWDVVTAADFDGPPVDELHLTVLPDGSMVVDEDVDENLSPLAEAVEAELQPPYRAEAVRRGERRWFVGARTITVVELPAELTGERVTLTLNQGERMLVVDGERSFGSVPALERLVEGDGYVLEAERIDDRFWEVRVTPL
ncbi:MAG: hypothetical protein WBB74_03910 [Gaiellaceae bacterium]